MTAAADEKSVLLPLEQSDLKTCDDGLWSQQLLNFCQGQNFPLQGIPKQCLITSVIYCFFLKSQQLSSICCHVIPPSKNSQVSHYQSIAVAQWTIELIPKQLMQLYKCAYCTFKRGKHLCHPYMKCYSVVKKHSKELCRVIIL